MHSFSFGRWQVIQWTPGMNGDKPVELKVRGMFVDGKLKEYTLGPAHEITERSFVVRRAFRINDALPEESPNAPQWRWEMGGWLIVDRSTGRLTKVSLPLMDGFYSDASWYRDYVAYWGISDDGKQLYAMVVQLGRRKPLLRKNVGSVPGSAVPGSAGPAPRWERNPARVTFELSGMDRLVFALQAGALDVLEQTENDGD